MNNSLRILLTLIIYLIFTSISYAQISENDTINISYFYHENGQVASMGYLEDGKPNGYWKTFHENGVIKSEGNRENFKLDGLWKFYNEEGQIILEINYKNDLKHGIRRTISGIEIIEENYENDIKNGSVTHYYPDSSLKKTTFFTGGREHGIAKEYSEDGTVIIITEYRNGIIVSRENINRTDRHGQKQGTWKYFFENGNIKLEGFYVGGKRNGFFKEYHTDGTLKNIEKYVNDELQTDVPELTKYEIRRDYYPDGSIRIMGSYRNGIPEGIRREYATDGQIENAYILKNGIIIGEGIIDAAGLRQGFWKEYYENGKPRAEGHYTNNIRTGEWKYYEESGSLKQQGKFNSAGFQIGEWKWFHENGKIQRIENFRNGKLDGLTEEYDEDGNLIAKGNYEEDYEDGPWFYVTNNYRQEGSFSYGRKNGTWKHFYSEGTLKFQGDFLDDYPDGKHMYYWDNGRLKEERNYILGNADGVWRKYTPEGLLFIYIDYKRGIEYRYDGIVIRPELD